LEELLPEYVAEKFDKSEDSPPDNQK